MELSEETRSLIAAELICLTAIEIRTFIGKDYPKRTGFADRLDRAQHLRDAAEQRLAIIVDDLGLVNLDLHISRLVQELDWFVEGTPEILRG